jgi:hypothetical protein
MKLFECQHCGQALFFENSHCESCHRRLGYLPSLETISALEPSGEGQWTALAAPSRPLPFCANAEDDVCNWLVEDADEGEIFCRACRHNRTIPSLASGDNLARWRKVEIAKRRLFYSLLRLHLPLSTRRENADGLAFDFLIDPNEGQASPSVLTGHDNGLITLNLAEADDVERERRRSQMHEPYRTLLGHFRHEVGHYYWDRLIRDDESLSRFRDIFGDERRDYAQALSAHYENGPAQEWRDSYVSAYASSHPWEDFAETWAHYLHLVDTLETAHSFGMSVRPRIERGSRLSADVPFDPYVPESFDRLVNAWLPLTFAMNSLNRSMGLQDLYPFVLCPKVIEKLSFVHDRVHADGDASQRELDKAMEAGQRNVVRPAEERT